MIWSRTKKDSVDVRILEQVLKSAKAKWLSAREVYDRAWLDYEDAARRLKEATETPSG